MVIRSAALLPVRELILDGGILDTILAHLRAAHPWEGVGLLATTAPNGTEPLIATRFFPGANVARSATRFQMDPRDVLAAVQAIRHHGWHLGAIVHSHLYGPATPSATDLREAYYPESLMLIASFATLPTDLRAWRIGGPDTAREAIEIPLVIR